MGIRVCVKYDWIDEDKEWIDEDEEWIVVFVYAIVLLVLTRSLNTL